MYLVKAVLLMIVLGVVLAPVSIADTIKQEDIKPFVPRIMAKGNGNVVGAQGLPSMWTNPAGIANFDYTQYKSDDIEITLFTLSLKSQPLPNDLITVYQGLEKIINNDVVGAEAGTNVINSSGVRLGAYGYGGMTSQLNRFFLTNKNLGAIGIGSSLSSEFLLIGYGSALATSALSITQAELYLGYAYRVEFYRLKLGIGTVMRPFARSYTQTGTGRVISSFADGNEGIDVFRDIDGLQGVGVGTDVGLEIEYFGLISAIAIRDIYTKLSYRDASTVDFVTGEDFGNVVSDNNYIIPYSLDVGVGYRIRYDGFFWKNIFNALIYVQLTDPLGNTNTSEIREEDFATHFHAGVDINFLPPLLSFQVGLNQGYTTMGMGTKIGIIGVNFVYYYTEEGKKIGEIPSPGLGVDFVIKW